jgi:hypothetical protein
MRKEMKKILVLILTAIMILSINITVFALNLPYEPFVEKSSIEKKVIKPFAGAREATEEQMKKWANLEKQATQKQMQRWAKNEKQSSKNIVSNTEIGTLGTNLFPFWYFGQEENYSCGAACIRMALKYLTGATFPELDMRDGCNTTTNGTYTSDMVNYINTMQDDNTYLARFNAVKELMRDNLYAGVVTFDAPPIIGVKESRVAGWPFNLGGHFLTIYSVEDDKSAFGICDPWAGYINDTNTAYDKSLDTLFDAYDSVNIGYMY